MIKLPTDLGIDPAYRHSPKQVTPGLPFQTAAVAFKWYALHRAEDPVPESIDRLARAKLAAGELGIEARGVGFVILHRCGASFYFLIACTWRSNNEIWQAVLYKDGEQMADFAPWPREGRLKPVFCVWELVAVTHESLAWSRFLRSNRDEAALAEWWADRYAGVA
jgi:hypothetical protein